MCDFNKNKYNLLIKRINGIDVKQLDTCLYPNLFIIDVCLSIRLGSRIIFSNKSLNNWVKK